MGESKQGFISSPMISGLWVERLRSLCERGVTSWLVLLVPGPDPEALGRGWSLEGASWRRRSLGPSNSGLGAGVGLGGHRGLWLRDGTLSRIRAQRRGPNR